MNYLYIEDAAILRLLIGVSVGVSICALYVMLFGLLRLKDILVKFFELFNHKLNIIMDNEAQAEQDIATILTAVTQEAQNTTLIAQELTDLRAQASSSGIPSNALVAKLDDLATRATAAAANLQALVPATPPPASNTAASGAGDANGAGAGAAQ